MWDDGHFVYKIIALCHGTLPPFSFNLESTFIKSSRDVLSLRKKTEPCMYFMNFTLVWSIGLHCELRIFLSYLADEYNEGMPLLRALEIVRNLQLSEVQENLLKYYRSLGAQLLVKYACVILKHDKSNLKQSLNRKLSFHWLDLKAS